MKKLCSMVICIAALLMLASRHFGRRRPPFYKGKTIRIVVGYSPGGGFDTFFPPCRQESRLTSSPGIPR